MREYLFHLFIYFYSKINFQNKYNHHSKNNVVIIRQLSGPSSKGKRILQYQVGRVLPYKKKFPISSVGDIFLFQTSTSSHTFLALQGFYNSDQDLYKIAREIRENWILGREWICRSCLLMYKRRVSTIVHPYIVTVNRILSINHSNCFVAILGEYSSGKCIHPRLFHRDDRHIIDILSLYQTKRAQI